MNHLEIFHIGTFAWVLGCWIGFGIGFLLRRSGSANAATERRGANVYPALFLQACGFAAVWTLRRQLFTHLVELGPVVEIATALLAILLASTSAVFGVAALRHLGRQWAVEARTVQEHHLVTTGPYSLVRHPIYTALYGLLLATALSVSTATGLVIGAVLYGAGTLLRTRIEDRLLRETFGATFDDYARRVPSLLPWTRP